MSPTSPATAYARLTTWQARGVLLALAAFVGFGIAVRPAAFKAVHGRPNGADGGDMRLYLTEIERMHAGENYYAVAAEELVAQGYPTRSVFNWRTPLPMWLIARLPTAVLGKVVLGGIGLAMLLMAFAAAIREEPNPYRRALPLSMLLVVGPLMPCILGNIFVMPVLWAGMLIALSLCAYGTGRPWLGAVAGVAAVFCRDLALPYCLLGALLALGGRRRGELVVWIAGLAGWAVFFALHCWQVAQFIRPDAVAHQQSWIRFGGTSFVLATVQAHPCLLLAPIGVTVFYFAAAMFGLAGWNTPLGQRVGLTVCMYVVAFSIVGQDFNRYWGILIAPLYCFGVVLAPRSFLDLWQAARLPRGFSWRSARVQKVMGTT